MQSQGAEIRFNLMAVIQDRSASLTRQLADLDETTEWQRRELEEMLAEDIRRKQERAKDMQLRRYNYIPLIMEILSVMAKNRPDLLAPPK
jgi:hypothetical protein